MNPFTGIRISALLLFCVAWAGASGALAQSYPSRPIHLVTGNPPGGATDFIARIIGPPLSARLGQNIVIDNRPGANTLLYANDSLLVVNPHTYSKMSVNPIRDLEPLVTTISNQLVLAINPKTVPVNDFPAFVEFARKPPAPLFYASIGNGSHHHLAMELLKQRAGIDLTHVPYKGGGPASIAVIAGENAVMFGGTSVVTHIKSGKLKGIAVSGDRGWPTMPDLPGIGEFYPGYKASLWHGMFLPRGTPPAVVARLRTEMNAVLALPEVREKLVSGGAGEPYITTPEEFSALLRADYERYGDLIKSIGFKAD
jgi:tripartite-type tricarboxylate transporter receptor subunit TctC